MVQVSGHVFPKFPKPECFVHFTRIPLDPINHHVAGVLNPASCLPRVDRLSPPENSRGLVIGAYEKPMGFPLNTVHGSEIPAITTWDGAKTLVKEWDFNYQPQLVIAGFLSKKTVRL